MHDVICGTQRTMSMCQSNEESLHKAANLITGNWMPLLIPILNLHTSMRHVLQRISKNMT